MNVQGQKTGETMTISMGCCRKVVWKYRRDLIAGAGDKRNSIGKGRISLSGDFGQVQVLAAEKRKKVIERLCCVHPTASQG